MAAACLLGCSYVGTVGASEVMPDDAAFEYCHDKVEESVPYLMEDTRNALAVSCLLGVTAHLNGMTGEEFAKVTDEVVESGQRTGDQFKRIAATRNASFMAEGFIYSRDHKDGSK